MFAGNVVHLGRVGHGSGVRSVAVGAYSLTCSPYD